MDEAKLTANIYSNGKFVRPETKTQFRTLPHSICWNIFRRINADFSQSLTELPRANWYATRDWPNHQSFELQMIVITVGVQNVRSLSFFVFKNAYWNLCSWFLMATNVGDVRNLCPGNHQNANKNSTQASRADPFRRNCCHSSGTMERDTHTYTDSPTEQT